MYCTKIEDKKNFDKILELRKEVFVEEQGFDEKVEFDVYDDIKHPKSIHYILIEGDNVIGTFRIINSINHVKFSRVCMKSDYRNKGHMYKAIDDTIDQLLDENIFNIQNKYFYVESQKDVLNFYKKLGFKMIGESFVIEGVEHQKMMLNVI